MGSSAPSVLIGFGEGARNADIAEPVAFATLEGEVPNPEHVRRIKQGVDVWNDWRLSYRSHRTVPDLRGVDLRSLGLQGYNLSLCDLSWSVLRQTDLRRCDLTGTDLSNADLSQANLGLADLRGANLQNCNLTLADLNRANLRASDLAGADLSLAYAYETLFVNVDLSRAKGLEYVQHRGPSSIDYRTLMRSGPLPLSFLQGSGVPDAAINLFGRIGETAPAPYPGVFISHSSGDREFVDQLHSDLQAKGVRVWMYTENMLVGRKFRDEIEMAIAELDLVLVVLSASSTKSHLVEAEVEAALEKESRTDRPVLLPVRIDDAFLSSRKGWVSQVRRQREIADFSSWGAQTEYDAAFGKLLQSLRNGF